MITNISFGKGQFRITDAVHGAPVILSVPGIPHVYIFEWHLVFAQLTFDWFKKNIICLEQKWACGKLLE